MIGPTFPIGGADLKCQSTPQHMQISEIPGHTKGKGTMVCYLLIVSLPLVCPAHSTMRHSIILLKYWVKGIFRCLSLLTHESHKEAIRIFSEIGNHNVLRSDLSRSTEYRSSSIRSVLFWDWKWSKLIIFSRPKNTCKVHPFFVSTSLADSSSVSWNHPAFLPDFEFTEMVLTTSLHETRDGQGWRHKN